MVDWISSLIKTNCEFCGMAFGHCTYACMACVEEMTAIEALESHQSALQNLPLISLFPYTGWGQRLILRQKQHPSKNAVQWLVSLLIKNFPKSWNGTPIVWLPGKALASFHLVEALALELAQSGFHLTPKPYLKRRLWPSKPQKGLPVDQRRSRDMSRIYKANRTAKNKEVLLLDDVFTTGSTLLGCQRLLEQQPGVVVRGALTLAYTPLKINEGIHGNT